MVYSHEVVKNPRRISPFDFKNVYRTQDEVSRAFRDGTFDVTKTMKISEDGKFYFLEWQSDEKKKEEDALFKAQQQKLNEMLKKQSGL